MINNPNYHSDCPNAKRHFYTDVYGARKDRCVFCGKPMKGTLAYNIDVLKGAD
jgi:hypothetical protein